ncbi:MAG: amino acid adenylation domain-containing protein [Gemmatimonadetes bacterium]|nr:amino acid adenylation domain-containing protein [Gemmatimonadota bacterium]
MSGAGATSATDAPAAAFGGGSRASGAGANGIVATYPLTPLQLAMLAQAVRSPGIGLDIGQVVIGVHERVDPRAMAAAWQRVCDHHETLRAAYAWDGLDAPETRIHAQVPVPFAALDWRAVPAADREARFAAWLREDRLKGFDLAAPAHWRVTLIQLDEREARVVYSLHHSLLDGRCFPVLFREAFTDYECLRDGRALPAQDPSPSFEPFVRWHERRDGAASDAFWKKTLGTLTHPTPLPIARVVSDTARAVQGDRETWMEAPEVAALRQLAERHGVALSTVVQGAWALVLARYAGEDDVTFGVTRAGRRGTTPDAEAMIGLCINTVPLRTHVRPDAPLGAWLRDLRAAWDALRDHEHQPPARIQAASGVGAGQLLFDSIVMFERYELEAVMQREGGAWADRTVRLHEQNAFGLTLAAYADERMLLRLVYDARRFDDDAIERMLVHLATMLRAMAAAAPTAVVGELDLLPAAERQQVLEGWAGPVVPRGPETLASALVAQAALTPRAVALVDARTSLAYAEVESATRALARRLRARGVGPGVRVGVAAERSVELAIALVAVVRAGGAWVPIDPEYPRERVQFMLEDSGVPLVLATRAVAGALPPVAVEIIELDGVADARDDGGPLDPPDQDDPAYMIYTSGSTGRPKGALNAHRGIMNRLRWMQEAYGLTARDAVLQKTPFSFDVSVWEFFWPLMAGARLVMAPPGLHRDAKALAEAIQAHSITTCHFVPSMLRAFVAEPAARGCTTLRTVVASGEALTGDVVAAFHGVLPRARLHNLYGPTECAVDVSHWTCPTDTAPNAVVPIGRPVANTRLYVLDARGRPCPIGVPGELVLAGVQVGLGYHARPELTAERFVPDPFAPKAEKARGARMYRSGDLARWRADGTIEYLGRLDFQVKVRGFRIELGEIEAAMTAHPHVAEAVVSAVEVPGAEKRLVAWAVAKGEAPSLAALRAFLKETLPDYMVPAQVMWLDALPLSSNGKVDRRALPRHVTDTGDRERLAPRTPAEATLARIWAEVLRVDAVGVEDDFFEVGGDSLLAIQVVARAARAGLSLTLTEALRQPTVAAQARAARVAAPAPVVQDAPVPAGTEVPLTPVQAWFAELDPEDPAHWNQALPFDVPATFDVAAFERAVAAVAAHHDVFRLRFTRATGGAWTARYAEAGTIGWSRVDHGDHARAAAELGASLDLANGPLARVAFLAPAGGPGRVLVVVHHMIVDGVSWRVLREDLDHAYAQAVAGSALVLPRATTWAAWARALEAERASAATAAELAYWSAQVAGPVAALPLRDAQAANVEGAVAFARARLGEGDTAALLQKVPAAFGTRINDALLAALDGALASWLGAGPVLVDLEGHGREDLGLDLSRSIGWFTTIFPVRLAADAGAPTRARLLAAKEALRGMPRNGLGFGLLRHGAARAALAQAPRAQILFNYLGQFEQSVAGGGVLAASADDPGPLRSARARRSHELEVILEIRGGALEVRIGHVPARHDGARVQQLADAIVRVLHDIVEVARTPGAGAHSPSDFPLASLDQPSLDALLGPGRSTDDVLPLTALQQLFLDTAGGPADPGLQQYGFTLEGQVDRAALRAAWQAVVDATPALRTRFAGTAERPWQVIGAPGELAWTEVRAPEGLDAAARDAWLAAWLAADRAAGIDVRRAPITRIALVDAEPGRTLMVWTHHHIILDRWSWPIVLRHVGAQYEARRLGVRPPSAASPALRGVVAAMTAPPDAHAEQYWRAETDGIAHAGRLLVAPAGDLTAAPTWIDESVALDPTETTALVAHWRARGLTLNTVVQGAWALALARVTATPDVSFGLTVAGRALPVPSVGDVVGVLINNVPVRARLEAAQPVSQWLATLQARQVELRAVEHVPLDQIQRWSALAFGQRLFESLVVFQDASAEAGMAGWFGPSVALRATITPTETAYPLTLLVTGDAALRVTLRADARWFTETQVSELARQLGAALRVLGGPRAAPGAGAAGMPQANNGVQAPVDADTAGSMRAGSDDLSVGAALDALPQAAWSATTAAARPPHVAPRDALETLLARQWSEVLGVSPIGVHDSLFALGGSSLAATQLAARARDRFRVDVAVRTVFEAPTVEAFARALVAREKTRGQVLRIAQLVLQVEGMSAEQLRAAAPSPVPHPDRGVST